MNILNPFDFDYQGLKCCLEFKIYSDLETKNLVIKVLKRKNINMAFPFASISLDMTEENLENDEFVLNNNPLYCEIIEYISNKNFFTDTGREVITIHGKSPVCKLNIY